MLLQYPVGHYTPDMLILLECLIILASLICAACDISCKVTKYRLMLNCEYCEQD